MCIRVTCGTRCYKVRQSPLMYFVASYVASDSVVHQRPRQGMTNVCELCSPNRYMLILRPHAAGRGQHAGRFVRFWASGGAKFTKICHSLRWTQTTTEQNVTLLALSSAEKSVTVQTNKQIVNVISTPCLSACVDNRLCEFVFVDYRDVHICWLSEVGFSAVNRSRCTVQTVAAPHQTSHLSTSPRP